ncbi:10223_t:CDS:2, partial [Acaulospora colombiana]
YVGIGCAAQPRALLNALMTGYESVSGSKLISSGGRLCGRMAKAGTILPFIKGKPLRGVGVCWNRGLMLDRKLVSSRTTVNMMAETPLQQGETVLPNLPQYEMKAEPTTPKRMLKSLKRAYSSSMACIETHMRLSSYQNVLQKKLVVKTFTKEDRQEVRKICEELVYTIQ